MLTCKNINVSYGTLNVLNDVSVSVEPGKVTAIVGPSGAGKSTILRTLAFLESPDSGSIEFDGVSHSFPRDANLQTEAPWPRITAVFQQFFLWPHLTLRQNILLPLELREISDREDRVLELTELFEMKGFIDRYPNQVSGGQRQRAALVRALALKPSYLLLDEITSAIDVVQSASIINHMADLKNEGIGILMVTHHLGFLERAADSIIYLDNGVVEESGGKEILNSPVSAGLKRFLQAFNNIEMRHYVNSNSE